MTIDNNFELGPSEPLYKLLETPRMHKELFYTRDGPKTEDISIEEQREQIYQRMRRFQKTYGKDPAAQVAFRMVSRAYKGKDWPTFNLAVALVMDAID